MGKRRKGGSKQAEGENDAEYSKRQKKDGEGQYPPPYELQSEAFESYYGKRNPASCRETQ